MLDCDQPCRNLSPVTATADLGQGVCHIPLPWRTAPVLNDVCKKWTTRNRCAGDLAWRAVDPEPGPADRRVAGVQRQ